MSQDWLKVEKCTADKPEIVMIARLLKIDQAVAFEKCFRVWTYFDTNTTDGFLPILDADWLDDHVKIKGFANAMADARVGWLLIEEGGGLRLPNFSRHNGETAKQRALSGKRMQKLRSDRNGSVTSAQPEQIRTEDNTPLPPGGGKGEFHPNGKKTRRKRRVDDSDFDYLADTKAKLEEKEKRQREGGNAP